MASKRWDRGRRTRSGGALDIQGTLGTLLRTTLHQMGVVKDAVERQARSSLGQLDTAKLQRRRREALARLGEVVWDLARSGELGELAERSEIAAVLDEIDELEASAEQAAEEGDAVSSAEWKPPAPGGQARNRRHHETMRVWRPTLDDTGEPHPDDEGDEAGPAARPEAGSEHRAESRSESRPGDKRGARPAARSEARSEGGIVPDTAPAREHEPPARPGRPGRRSRQPDDGRTGGIAFIEDGPGDDDLAEYMNDDDVPRRK